MTDELPEDPHPALTPKIIDALAELQEEAERGRRQRAGEHMVIGPGGELGGLGAPPGQLRSLVRQFAAIEAIRSEGDLEQARAIFLEHYEGPGVPIVKSVTWAMIQDARRG